VTAKGKHPAPGYTAWLDIESVTDDRREYRLVAEPPFPAQAGPEPGFTARDQFRGPATAISLIVVDSQGPHEIQVPATNIVHVLGTPGAVKDRLADAGLAVPHHMPKGIATELHVAEHVVKVVAEDLFTEVSGTDEAIAMLSELL
ncbi:MAG TPA: hypothetical protein VEA16_14135, partial [Vicinamibacterales bacterium]|nr:hypothetical protein [Vicinamibacterales bacterium]